ncbi:hypothetical protein [Paracoccus sp. (in: a-proteobacteria)]|uniref:hypothetical protein n=1 Tax=Paracoccus sp. TaxID=267 RepID=UPI003A87E057
MNANQIRFSEALDQPALIALAGYVMHRPASVQEMNALLEVAESVVHLMNEDKLRDEGAILSRAREKPTALAAMEVLTALVARALCRRDLGHDADPPPDQATGWISSNVTAGAAHLGRARAIWRDRAGRGFGNDRKVLDHALQSAKAGATADPVPEAQPEDAAPDYATGETPLRPPASGKDHTPPSETGQTGTPPKTGKEKIMTDPTPTRDRILSGMAFNPAGLPAILRNETAQKAYVDAIVTAVAMLGHEPRTSSDGSGLDEAEQWASATTALMLIEGHYNPSDSRFFAHVQRIVAELSGPATESSQIRIDGHSIQDGQIILGGGGGDPLLMSAPSGANQRIALFSSARTILQRRLGKGDRLFLQSWAIAGRKAVDSFSDHGGDSTLMTPTVDAAYNDDIASGGAGGGGGGIANVELPPLNDPAGYNDEVERENVRAVSTIYVSYQLEFAITACARVLELFVAGLLPIPASDGSARELDNLYWDQEDMLNESARRSVYARVLGAPGGELSFDIQPNTEFNTLLMRSVSAISEYEREQSAITHFDNAARGRRFQTTSGEFVRKAIRDFAANASLRGWAGTAFTAERMAKQIRRVMKVLNLPSVRTAFGVTTPWQVIERVSQREFGITVNTVLHRTLAVETQRIMGIIADNHTVWSNTTGGRPLFSSNTITGDLSLTDSDALIIAAQHFRAVTGIGDGLMNEYSEPVEVYAAPSLPSGGGMAGMGGGAMAGVNMEGISQLRNLVNSGQTPSPDQILSMLPRI